MASRAHSFFIHSHGARLFFIRMEHARSSFILMEHACSSSAWSTLVLHSFARRFLGENEQRGAAVAAEGTPGGCEAATLLVIGAFDKHPEELDALGFSFL